MGWNSHVDHINALAARIKAEKAIKPVEKKAAQSSDDAKGIDQLIPRGVVKNIQDLNRTACNVEDTAIRLRQRAIDAANTISGFDDATVPSK